MIKLLINFLFFFILFSCKNIENIPKNKISNIVVQNKTTVEKTIIEKPIVLSEKIDTIFYLIGDPYFIEGVKYIPKENYSYNETGLASFYGKELHNFKTANNDLNKVTDLLGRHKTLPVPSIVKLTNLENGLSVTVKIVDRYQENSTIIQVSRKVAQLLRFYKNKIARVRVKILPDPSKQWKNVTLSMNDPKFNVTVESVPTDSVSISNLDENDIEEKIQSTAEKPIEIGSEPVQDTDLFIKIYNFKTYEEIQIVLKDLNLTTQSTIERSELEYNLIIGPIKNEVADKLVSSFITKGYKETEIILK